MPNIVKADGIISSTSLDLFSNSYNSFFKINTGGDIGINRVSSISNYTVFSFDSLDKNNILNFQQYNNTNTFRLRVGSNQSFFDFYAPLSSSIHFFTNNVRRLSIGSAGSLGVGISSNYGTTNQAFTSQGSTLAPTWSTLNNSAISATAAIAYSKLSLNNSILDSDISSSASISDTKLATISTAGKVSNSATTATVTDGITLSPNTIVLRNSGGYIFNRYFNSTDNIDNGTTNSITYIMAKFGDNYFRSATAAKVAAFLSGQSMDISGNATTAGGLAVHAGRNNETNRIVRTDANGYLQLGYINSSDGNENLTTFPSYLWCTNGSDSYLRTYKTSYVNGRFYTSNNAYLVNNWDGSYWSITCSDGTSVRVAKADNAGSTGVIGTGSVSSGSFSSSGNFQRLNNKFAYAWVRITPTTANALNIGASYNISSVTDNGTSQFNVNFPNRGTTRYFVAACNSRNASYWLACSCYNMTATSVTIKSTLASGGWGTTSSTNPGFASSAYPGMSVIIY